MLPNINDAVKLLLEAEVMNPGPWEDQRCKENCRTMC